MKVWNMKTFRAFVALFIVCQSLILAFLMRPIQDDYFNLESVQRMGVMGYLIDTWENHGGNMVQFLIHCLVILPTTQSFVFWNLGLFFLTSQIFVFASVRILNSWLFTNQSTTTRFWIPLLSVAGFEGLFVPGFLGAYGFSLASLAHLWPVMAFVVALLALKEFTGSWVLAFILGLVAGNSNLGESAFACGVWLLVLGVFKWSKDFEELSGIKKSANFYSLGLGTFIGTIGIAAAPGFWVRASDQVGLPESLGDFAVRFLKSFASFTADALTHPMIWVLFFLGVYIAKSERLNQISVDYLRVKLLAISSFLIWVSLVMGATFAYPAWHQSMGMYVLLLPLAFALGVVSANKFGAKMLTFWLVLSSIVMTVTFLRIGILGVERSIQWDQNLQINSCRIAGSPNADLLGAEIRYEPFKLGVEDVNTWEWMRTKYVGWVKAIPQEKCES
jgi:hypothetical protein